MWSEGPLGRIGKVLARTSTRTELARCEATEQFPEEVVADIGAAGLRELFTGGAHTTAYHINTLNAASAQESGSLAITLGITGLALLPIYMAGTDAQLAWAAERLEAGGSAAMLLSELDAESNLAAIGTRATAQPGGGYLVRGDKQIINLGRRASLLMTLARTSDPPERASGLGGAGGLTLLCIERDATVEPLNRWRTMPAPAADIGGVRFHDTRVPESARIGGEGDGFRLVQGALTLSRGGISGFASGTASRACGLAFAYAGERAPFGQPIAQMGAIADHLARMAALDLATTCLSLSAAAAANAQGLRAAYATAVAKLMACDLAERAVSEGRAVLSARALLAELPYQQVVRDVILYGIFDGTRHVMLDQIQWRVRQMTRPASTRGGSGGSGGGPLAAAGHPIGAGDPSAAAPGATYRTPPRPLPLAARERGRPQLSLPSERAARLAAVPGAIPLDALSSGAAAVERALGRLPPEAWSDQAVAFALAQPMAQLEAVLAVAELANPVRRAALGLCPAAAIANPGAALPAEPLCRYAVALLGGEALADARRVLAGAGHDPGDAALAAERALAVERAAAGARVRAAIQDRPTTT